MLTSHQEIASFIERDRNNPGASLTSWVSPAHKYFYMGLGKTASTRIKLTLHTLEGFPVLERPFPWLHARTKAQEAFVPKLADFTPEQALEVLTSPKWFRFCFVRNPYDRLFSAYKSNIMQEMMPPSPVYRKIREQIRVANNYPGGSSTVSFRDFVRYVQETIDSKTDYHWCTIRQGLHPDLIGYDFVGRFENFEADFRQVLHRLGVDDELMPALVEPVNRSNVRQLPLAAVYDRNLADRVYEIYKDDFETYGYERDSWLYG